MGGDLMNIHLDEMDLFEYIDHVLNADDRVRVSNHLSSCPLCRQKIAEIKLMYYELDHLEAIEIPKALEDIRNQIVSTAFEGEKISTFKSLNHQLKVKQKKISGSFMGRHALKQGEKMTQLSKSIWSGGKKIVASKMKKNKSDEKAIKKKTVLRRLL